MKHLSQRLYVGHGREHPSGDTKGDHTPIWGKDTKNVLLLQFIFTDQPCISSFPLLRDRFQRCDALPRQSRSAPRPVGPT